MRLPQAYSARLIAPAVVLFFAAGAPAQAEAVVVVEVFSERSIEGVSRLDRKKYFAISHQGNRFDELCGSQGRYRRLVKEAQVSLGRRLGLVHWHARPGSTYLSEDPHRPGYADLPKLVAWFKANRDKPPSRRLRADFGDNLDVACHGQHNAYPEFMGKHFQTPAQQDKKPEWLPENTAAAAELAAAVLRHHYNAFTRPRYYEPINEPHWSYYSDKHLADWHLKTLAAVKRETPDVLVGGPCLPVAYFYGRQYDAFKGFKAFLDGTDASLDFYSFHVYDYLSERDGRFGGRITSGLPLESVLDLVQNHSKIKHGKSIKLVVSEHGGYGAEDLVESIAGREFPGDSFTSQMKKRSIKDANAVRSILANTMVFLDHPHVLLKAVPFILLNSFGWDPRYDAVLYVPDRFEDRDSWVPSKRILFYDFFRGLSGRRVKAFCPDPDLQVRAFVDGAKAYVVLNNLADKPEPLRLRLQPPDSCRVRRLGTNPDSTPYLREEAIDSLDGLRLGPREAMMLVLNYETEPGVRRRFEEVVCYGDRTATPVAGGQNFRVDVPEAERLDYAVLRIGVSRPAGADKQIRVEFNGKRLEAPLEDCAEWLDSGDRHGYASMKILLIPKEIVRQRNRIRVTFPDGGPGTIGAVVLRAGLSVAKPAG